MGEHGGVRAAGEFQQGADLLRPHERAGAVVDENLRDVRRQRGEGGGDRVLAFAPPADEKRRRGREGGQREHLAAVPVDDNVEIGHPAGGERGGRMRKDRPARERSENLVRDRPAHAGAAPGGEENDGGFHEKESGGWIQESGHGASISSARIARAAAAGSFAFRTGRPTTM